MKLTSKRLRLRAPEPDDVDFLFILENDESMAESGFTTAPVSRFMLDEYLRHYNADIYAERQLRLVVELKDYDERIGFVDLCDFSPRDRRAFVSIALLERFRDKGYGTEALQLVCDYARETLGLHQLAAQIAYDNEASRALFGKCGFHTCGSMRSWVRRGPHYVDALLYQLLFPN
ncbi:MAG: GNAT family N-acetyltransferase [Bacteroidales bacterium]|nr:GNAT family N-acetyltransferase [Bacteroidales bacterium]MBD5177940.1 GNAT family N-acetyltransferase [Bacteroidales bacterium]